MPLFACFYFNICLGVCVCVCVCDVGASITLFSPSSPLLRLHNICFHCGCYCRCYRQDEIQFSSALYFLLFLSWHTHTHTHTSTNIRQQILPNPSQSRNIEARIWIWSFQRYDGFMKYNRNDLTIENWKIWNGKLFVVCPLLESIEFGVGVREGCNLSIELMENLQTEERVIISSISIKAALQLRNMMKAKAAANRNQTKQNETKREI